MSGAFDVTRKLISHRPDTIKRYTRFTSTKEPQDILKKLEDVLAKMPIGFRLIEKFYKIKVTATSRTGMITFSIQIMLVTDKLYMVDFARSRV